MFQNISDNFDVKYSGSINSVLKSIIPGGASSRKLKILMLKSFKGKILRIILFIECKRNIFLDVMHFLCLKPLKLISELVKIPCE